MTYRFKFGEINFGEFGEFFYFLKVLYSSIEGPIFCYHMWEPCQRNQTNSLESGFYMVAKKAAELNGIDFENPGKDNHWNEEIDG